MNTGNPQGASTGLARSCRTQREVLALRALASSSVSERDEVLDVVASRLLRDLERLSTAMGPARGNTAASRVVVRKHRKAASSVV